MPVCFLSLINDECGNLLVINSSTVTGLGPGAAFTHCGYGLSSHWSRTCIDTPSLIAVRAGIEERSFPSSIGAEICCANRPFTTGGHCPSSNDSARGRE